MGMEFQFNFEMSPPMDLAPTPQPDKLYDVLILGGGPAGLNGALYCQRKGLSVAVLAKRLGGQVSDTSAVENYLGVDPLSGDALVQRFIKHLRDWEVPLSESVEVQSIQQRGGHFYVSIDSGQVYQSKSILIALGSKSRKLGIPGEVPFLGRGIAYCAICDGPLFRDKTVVVAGGGNSAVEAALDLSKIASKVMLVHRSQLRADAVLIQKLKQTSNIDIYLETLILEAIGEKTLKCLRIQRKGLDKEEFLGTEGLFVEIGYDPNTGFLKGFLDLNTHGEILVDDRQQTSVPGIFAAGDITQTPYKQIIIAAGDGAKAALAINEYLTKHL